jgi:Zn-dependent M28 family amino/carboxypeptidase
MGYGSQILAWSLREEPEITVEGSEVVFVGYGINAPDYGWNDYEGIDVRGKTVLMLINDPGYASGDPAIFNGKAMTYYGRWTYKFEEAARQGAAAALLIHQKDPAGYPWDVVQSSWSGPQFSLVSEDKGQSRVAVEAWVSSSAATALLQRGDLTLDEAQALALSPDFKAMPLPVTFSAKLNSTVRHTTSHNVMAVREGATAPDEALIYMAHWDHLGTDPSLKGDKIYNGALDNATGTAGLMVLADAFSKAPTPPRRSVAFLAVTAEEQGLLGSAYYAAHPAFAPHKTVAAINMDGLNIHGPTKDITLIGWQQNDLQDMLEAAAQKQDRMVVAEPTPQNGYFYRSDHFSLAKVGIPALYADSGVDSRAHGREWGLAQQQDYIDRAYHKPADEYDPNWDLSGAVEDLLLFYEIGHQLAYGDRWPLWKEGSEFRAIREQDLEDAQ